MPGFFIEIGDIKSFKHFNLKENFIIGSIKEKDFFAYRFTLNKFLNDKLFINNSAYFCVLDGVILNKREICLEKKRSWDKAFIELYETNGNDFFKQLRGSFCGVLYDKIKKKWIIFTDHIGSKHIYLSKIKDALIIATDIRVIYDYYKMNNIDFSIDITGAYFLLSYGFMLEDYTLCGNIKKLLPGHYLVYRDSKISYFNYFKLNNLENIDKSEKELIDLMDFYFRQAIKRQFEKDLEYGYRHFVALSGGLDSRMTTWVANTLGYKNQVNFTFSQTEYLDEEISKKIAENLGHEWIFKSLDGGFFLLEIDNITQMTGGNVLYYGLAHGYSLFKYLNFTEFGVIHTGQLGDVIFGTYIKIDDLKNWKHGDGAFSKKLIHRISKIKLKMEYENKEIFMLYNRGFSGINSGLLVAQQYTETMSPFYDVDLLNFALSIPLKYRYNHRIYKKWIIAKYPEAATYVWEKKRSKITEPILKFKNKEYYLREFIFILINKIFKGKFSGYYSKYNMNPLGYYYSKNDFLRKKLDDYFYKYVDLVSDHILKKDLNDLYVKGNIIEKIQVLSLISAIKTFFSK